MTRTRWSAPTVGDPDATAAGVLAPRSLSRHTAASTPIASRYAIPPATTIRSQRRPTSRAITGTATRNAASTTVRGPKNDLMCRMLRLWLGRLRALRPGRRLGVCSPLRGRHSSDRPPAAALFDRRLDSELLEDGIRHRRRCARERVASARHLRKRDDLSDVGLAREERDEALDAHREAPVRRRAHAQRVEEELELRLLLLGAHAHDAEDRLLPLRVVDSNRAGAELPSVPDQVVMLAEDATGIALDPVLVARDGRGEGMVDERPPLALLVVLEEREVERPREAVGLAIGEVELAAQMRTQAAEHPRDRRLVGGGEERRRVRVARERRELVLGEELRDRGSNFAAVVDEVREALRPPFLRDLFQPAELGTREGTRRDEIAHDGRSREDAELRRARDVRRVLDLEPEPKIGLVGAVPQHHVRELESRERTRRRLAPQRLEAHDHALLQDVEHVLALDERHLQVELPELELPVGAEILVTPARCDLVVAVHPAHYAELLEQLRRLHEREEVARLMTNRDEEVECTLGCALRHRRRPDVDEAELVHPATNRRNGDVRDAEVALHALCAHVEPAVTEAKRLVDVLLVQLERQRRGARDDPQRVHLHLDLPRGQVRVHCLGRARDHFALRLEDELVAHVVCFLGGLLRPFGIDDELDLAGVVAQVDEDETAVVAARVRPAGDGYAAADVGGGQLAAHRVAPAHASSSFSSSTPETGTSSSPGRRSVQPSRPAMTVARAFFCPYVSWPLSERPAWSQSAEIPAVRSW